ncbi:MAG: sigma 54-interacting transcriptional regulator [Pirellula sp.]
MQPNNSSAYLIIRQGQRWTDVFRLEPAHPLIIGRASSNEIPVADERSSRRHAEIFFDEGAWKVRDLGSRNGTFVDGQRLSEPKILSPGNQIAVANCRLTFASSLDDVVPPLETEESALQTTANTQAEFPSITYRQSKSSILDPAALGLELAPSPKIAQKRQDEPAVAIELLQLAFDVARQPSVHSACELALDRLMKAVACNSGGVLKLELTNKVTVSPSDSHSSSTVLTALQRNGKAYHPVTDTLVSAVLRDDTAILARNVHSDAYLVGGQSGVTNAMTTQASSVLTTSSVIVAPLRVAARIIGLVHLYSRVGEPELTPENLEVVLAVADVLAVTLDNLYRQQALETKLQSTRHRVTELEQQLGKSLEWIGPSVALKQLRDQAQRVGPTQATVLIRGESGAGKELVARAIHDFSPRANNPFVAINCAALTATLLESELFGHEKGSFTGATDRKIGKFEQAHTGTIMLDELGEMSLEIQAKFLRVLEGKPFERVGGNKPIQVDVRVIAATNRDLETAVKDGQFRSDLYFRLRVIELRVPSLRQRPEDILPLADYFLAQFKSRSGHGPEGFSERAQRAMTAYHWPGNVRELRNCVERAFVLATGTLADPEDLALSYLQVPGQEPAANSAAPASRVEFQEKTIDALEQEHIEATLAYTGGQKNRAAAILGIERSTLDRKLKRFGG